MATFSWTESPEAIEYLLTVSINPDFSNPVIEESHLRQTTFISQIALEKGFGYYWKVEAKNKSKQLLAENSGQFFRVIADAVQPSPGISKYFVHPNGIDNPDRGSSLKPFKTVAYAVSQVPAGEQDTLMISAGTFPEVEPIQVPVGVNLLGAGQDVSILSSTGVTVDPKVDQSSADFKLYYDGSLIQIASPQRVTPRNINSAAIAPENGDQFIKGFTIDGNSKSLKAGIWVENRNNVALQFLTFKNISQRGAVVAAGNKKFYTYPTFYLTGIQLHDLSFINCGKDLTDETLGNLNIAQLDGADIYNINIEDNEGYGIKFIYDGYFKNISIHDCKISVSEQDSKWGEDISIELWNLGAGNKISNVECNTWLSLVNHPEVFGSTPGEQHVQVSNIRMIDKDGVSSKEAVEIGAPGVEISNSYFQNKGIGMAIWNMGRADILIHHNVFYNSQEKDNWASGAAVYIDNSRTWEFKNIKIYNNVFDTHKIAIRTTFSNAGISDIDIKNNVFFNSSGSELQAMGTDIDFFNNLKFNVNRPSWSIVGATSEGNNLDGNPMFINTGERWDTFYRPSLGSIVIDNGVDVSLPFEGNAPDIGAFEY